LGIGTSFLRAAAHTWDVNRTRGRPQWRQRGFELTLGTGIAIGYATCGEIGFDGRTEYTAIGTVDRLSGAIRWSKRDNGAGNNGDQSWSLFDRKTTHGLDVSSARADVMSSHASSPAA
jgi:hypothetical protein